MDTVEKDNQIKFAGGAPSDVGTPLLYINTYEYVALASRQKILVPLSIVQFFQVHLVVGRIYSDKQHYS